MSASSIISYISSSKNAPKQRDDIICQPLKLINLVGQHTFVRINKLVKNFENNNHGLSVIKVQFYRALRKLLKDSDRDSFVISGPNINHTIKEYVSNNCIEEYLLNKVFAYIQSGCTLKKYSRILVIAILLNFKITKKKEITYEYNYSFKLDSDKPSNDDRIGSINGSISKEDFNSFFEEKNDKNPV